MRETWEAIIAAAADRRSGSARVARAAAEALARLSNDLAGAPPEDVHLHATEAVRVLLDGQPIMAACIRLADTVVRALDAPLATGERIGEAARAFRERLDREDEQVARALREELPRTGTILTVSASSSVIDALARIGRNRVEVLCAASEPGGEGTGAADELREAGLAARVIPDAAVAAAAGDAGLVVFGADAVGPSELLNKVGTLAAALGAREGRVRCLAVAGSSKLVDRNTWTPISLLAPTRLATEAGAAWPVFETVPLKLISAVVTDEDTWTTAEVGKAAGRAKTHPLTQQVLEEVVSAAGRHPARAPEGT